MLIKNDAWKLVKPLCRSVANQNRVLITLSHLARQHFLDCFLGFPQQAIAAFFRLAG